MNIDALIGRYAVGNNISALPQLLLNWGNSRKRSILIDIYYVETHVSFAQVYPYFKYRKIIAERYGATTRFFPIRKSTEYGRYTDSPADIVLFQTMHGAEDGWLLRFLEKLHSHSSTRICYIDSFAHNDLRKSRLLDDYIFGYIKKSFFKNTNLYFKSYIGSTNLTEFYADLYGIELPTTSFHTPPSILNKIRKSPGFFMSPRFMSNYSSEFPPFSDSKSINVHARFGASRPDAWYNTMRTDLLDRVRALGCPAKVTGAGIRRRQYMAELRRSKICVSPFGYGELCWRDVEAFQTGAVLVKPDMSHLETLPDLYVPYETYVPIRWDFSDLERAVDIVLNDDGFRERIAFNAYERIHDYIRNERFVDDISFLFE